MHRTVPDSYGGLLRRPETEGLWGPYDCLPALLDSVKPSVTTPQGHPPRKVVRQGEVFRSPSSPDVDPLRMSSAEKGGDPNYKVKFWLSSSEMNKDVSHFKPPSLLTARWRADPLGGAMRPGHSPAPNPLTKISSPALRPLPPGLQRCSSSFPG